MSICESCGQEMVRATGLQYVVVRKGGHATAEAVVEMCGCGRIKTLFGDREAGELGRGEAATFVGNNSTGFAVCSYSEDLWDGRELVASFDRVQEGMVRD